MAEIVAEITRKGAMQTIREQVPGNKMSDLIVSLKAIKQSTNELMTTFVQEDLLGARKAESDDVQGEDEVTSASSESEANDGIERKRLKT
ncbi:uncharacterized protein LOC128273636 [Anopheles cruzii]|uniref:uncharacterized protein LOC128273636 n=1 Tax=Anopheles cruzii TaxID=68878 RepID=UPI0022EC5A7D|nr:uncharacterized protein LOC128273636 [Anopheles cruzii]